MNSVGLDYSRLNSVPVELGIFLLLAAQRPRRLPPRPEQERSLESSRPCGHSRNAVDQDLIIVLLPGWWVPCDARGPHTQGFASGGAAAGSHFSWILLPFGHPSPTLRTGCLHCLSKWEEFLFPLSSGGTSSFSDTGLCIPPPPPGSKGASSPGYMLR